MSKHIVAHPLCWPYGWPRTKQLIVSRFRKWNKEVTITKATDVVIDQFRLFGVPEWSVIISSDLKLRQDGLPKSGQRIPDDIGIAVWWKEGAKQRVIALDQYNRIADNLYAIGKTVEAMRSIERWGGGEILERTFTGFTHIEHIKSGWRDVLEYDGSNLNAANKHYKVLRSLNHPDKGGDKNKFYEINQAWTEAERELS